MDSFGVLLIDPDTADHDVVASAIGGEFAFLGAKSIELGVRLAARRPPGVAVIDVSALKGPLEDITAELRAGSASLRFIFLSAPGVDTSGLTSFGAVLPKPIDPERLLQAVRHAVKLQGMSAGVERLKTRTGQFATTPRPGTEPGLGRRPPD